MPERELQWDSPFFASLCNLHGSQPWNHKYTIFFMFLNVWARILELLSKMEEQIFDWDFDILTSIWLCWSRWHCVGIHLQRILHQKFHLTAGWWRSSENIKQLIINSIQCHVWCRAKNRFHSQLDPLGKLRNIDLFTSREWQSYPGSIGWPIGKV